MDRKQRIQLVGQFKHLVSENKMLIVAAVCATIFVFLLSEVLESESMKLDQAAYWLIVENLRQPWLTPIMESFSNLATPVSIAVLWVVITAFAPGKRAGWCSAPTSCWLLL